MISGGANVTIEICRQAIAELTKSLLRRGFVFPDSIMFQFDNCGEMKNQFVFAYFSMLVQTQQIKHIELHFLLVGHTHCSIDQYFSVLSKVWTDFFSSPIIVLKNLFFSPETCESAFIGFSSCD